MPIYEFVCQSCDNQFEKIQSFSDTSVPICPTCASSDVARQMGRPAIHFKGSGWYINDSKKATKESANGQSKNDADGAKSSEDGSSSTDGEGAKGDVKEPATKPATDSASKTNSPASESSKAAVDKK